MRRRLAFLTGVLALSLAAAVAQADAHGLRRDWHDGFFARNAIVTGTVTAVGNGSFTANAYVMTPGAGDSSATPATTSVTINENAETKVVVLGQSALQAGDTFYATYVGQSSSTPISTIVSGDAARVLAYAAPTPRVEVRGVITAAPTSGDPDQFTATAAVVAPLRVGGLYKPIVARPVAGPPASGIPVSGTHAGTGGAMPAAGGTAPAQNWGHAYSYRNQVGGSYGFAQSTAPGDGALVSAKTPNTTITVDSNTKLLVDGVSEPVSDLAVGQTFTAVFNGTPDEALSQIVSGPALSVTAHTLGARVTTPHSLYAFVGTVTATNTTSSPETVSVAVTESRPTGLLSGTETFAIAPTTFVFGGKAGSMFGSLSSVKVGDVVAGGLIASTGQTAAAVQAAPLKVLVDLPAASATNTAAATAVQIAHLRREELRRTMRLLHRDAVADKRHEKHRK